MTGKWATRAVRRGDFVAFVEVDFGKVFVSVPEAYSVDGVVAREIAEALVQMADIADAQTALRQARDLHGAQSQEAQDAATKLDALRAKYSG